MTVIFPVLTHRVQWELPEGIHESAFTHLGRALLPSFGVRVNGSIVSKLHFILENITESTAKATADQQKPLGAPAKLFLITGEPSIIFQLSKAVSTLGQQHLLHVDSHFWGS